MDRTGAKEIQLALFKSYGTNLAEYPKWQAAFRQHQPPALILWGIGDRIFPPAGAHPYRRDLKNVELHFLNGGHFVLETHLDFVADKMRVFMARTHRGKHAGRWNRGRLVGPTHITNPRPAGCRSRHE